MKSKTVVLVHFYRKVKYIDADPLIPLACLYLATYLKERGYKPIIQEIESTEDIDKCVNEAIAHNPILIGLSASPEIYTNEYIMYSKKIKESKNIPIVWGGVHASAIYDLCLKESYIDYVIRGEGEIALYELTQAIEGKKDFNTVRNLAYKNNGNIILNNEKPIFENDIDQFALNFDLLSNYEKYIQAYGNTRILFALQTSRGCPHDCSFCYNSVLNNRRWRAHSVERIISDVEKLKKKVKFNKISAVDDQYCVNKTRAKEIIIELSKINVSLTYPLIRLEDITEELLDFFLKYNIRYFYFGSESNHDRLLKLMNKGYSSSQIIEKYNIIAKYPSIIAITSLIVGLPTNTKEEIQETIKFVLYWNKKISNLKISINIYFTLPGTKLFYDCISLGYPKPESIEIYSNSFISENNLYPKRCEKMEWLNLSSNFKKKLTYLHYLVNFHLLLTPLKGHSILQRLFFYPFRIITYYRIKFLFPYFMIERKIFSFILNILRKLFEKKQSKS